MAFKVTFLTANTRPNIELGTVYKLVTLVIIINKYGIYTQAFLYIKYLIPISRQGLLVTLASFSPLSYGEESSHPGVTWDRMGCRDT